MRTVRIHGGLGNQLFCLAFADSVAQLCGASVGLDLTSYGGDPYSRLFLMKEFVDGRAGLVWTPSPLMGSRLSRAVRLLIPLPGFVSERRRDGDRLALETIAARHGYFDGYWQNEAYIKDPVEFAAAVRAFVLARADAPPAADLVIHFRTYKEERRASARRTPGTDYFRRALAALGETGERPRRALLLSDDPDLARSRIGDIGLEIVTPEGNHVWRDMGYLMRARRLILTNSSFSWWGGFCNPDAEVTYPARNDLHHYPAPAGRFRVL